MPKEIRDVEQFERLMSGGLELRVVRSKENVKLKLRTPEYLYTLKTNADQAANMIKSAKDIEVIEISPKQGKEEDKKSDQT